MQLDRYEFVADDDFVRFTFYSTGPRGVIEKRVDYSYLYSYNNIAVVNLGFGDWDIDKQKIDDSVVSNNNDRDKVLATVAATVLKYTMMHGPCFIYAQGSTPARTRLYQMGINAHRAEIESIFTVLGLFQDVYMQFESKRNFEAFLIYKK